ncbi:hypothetical protein [Niveispirillum sp.]|uniref:phage head-tail joining protein n=1 Tax=Niveispirillum sp. TaxID=1917217 RepID=UPI001B4E3F84|nr:hypothetical protein [Niveispirillum sp.]MBP7339421.1 hypothetical protein [Niveispirillum sp.]
MDAKIFASLSDVDLTRLRDDLLQAHAQGAERIRFQDRDVTLRSITNVESMIRSMNAELAGRTGQTTTRPAHRGVVMVSRGNY